MIFLDDYVCATEKIKRPSPLIFPINLRNTILRFLVAILQSLAFRIRVPK